MSSLSLPSRNQGPAPDAIEGIIERALTDARFRVRIGSDRVVIAHFSSDLRLRPPRLLPGTRVLVQIAVRNPTRARIICCA
jgi:translation initiation factor IF-1